MAMGETKSMGLFHGIEFSRKDVSIIVALTLATASLLMVFFIPFQLALFPWGIQDIPVLPNKF